MEEFPAQTAAVINAERNGRLSHAYIVHSDNSETSADFSLFLACVATCPDSSEGRPCGVCKVCTQLANANYPELFTLMPTSKSRRILVGDTPDDPDTVRWFQSQFHLTNAGEGRKKVGIIDDADCINTQGQNAFLKTLEEPPSAAIFILTTAKPQSLLPTIRSRCHSISLLKNVCDYSFTGVHSIVTSLFKLQTCEKNHLMVGEDVTAVLLEVSSSFKDQAEKRVTPKWKARIAEMERACDEATPGMEQRHWNSMLKMLNERCESAINAEYLGLRMVFTSLIHTWFAQTYQLSCGAALSDLSHPELYEHIDINNVKLPEDKALKHLRQAETLIANLQWSVSETLAFREFCSSFALH